MGIFLKKFKSIVNSSRFKKLPYKLFLSKKLNFFKSKKNPIVVEITMVVLLICLKVLQIVEIIFFMTLKEIGVETIQL